MPNRRYYSLITDDQNDSADLFIFGDITSYGQWYEGDPDRSAYDIVREINALEASSINVHINSYGGDVFEGLAIYNTLKGSNKNITTYCDGCACSAASVVFMAGEKRVMSPASLLMIHNAWTVAMGNSEELHKQADDLEKITQASVEVYKLGASISEDEIKGLMDEETWILPDQAVEWGFATGVSEEEESGVKQSAFGLIMQKLTAPDPVHDAIFNLDKETFNKALNRAIARIDEIMKREERPDSKATKQPTIPKTPAQDKYGWEKFFK